MPMIGAVGGLLPRLPTNGWFEKSKTPHDEVAVGPSR